MKPAIAHSTNAIVLISIGIFYGGLLQYLLPNISVQFGEPLPDILKMTVTFSTALMATIAIYFFNILALKQNMLSVGIAAMCGAIFWYYIIKGYPNILSSVYISFISRHSAFAVLSFMLLPIIFGVILKSWFNYSGFLSTLGNSNTHST